MTQIKDKIHAIERMQTEELVFGFGEKAMCGIDGFVNTSPAGLQGDKYPSYRKCRKCLKKLNRSVSNRQVATMIFTKVGALLIAIWTATSCNPPSPYECNPTSPYEITQTVRENGAVKHSFVLETEIWIGTNLYWHGEVREGCNPPWRGPLRSDWCVPHLTDSVKQAQYEYAKRGIESFLKRKRL